MSKCAKCPSRAITRVLDVVALGRLVDFRVELLLSPGMAILTGVSGLAAHGVTPFVPTLHVGTGRRSVLELFGAAPLIFVIVKLGAGVALTAQPRRLFARLCLVVGQNVGRVQPFWIIVEEAALLV